jgi:hypothetical protein
LIHKSSIATPPASIVDVAEQWAEDLMKSRHSTARRVYLGALFAVILAGSLLNAGAADALDGSSCPKVNPVGVDGKGSVMSGPRLLDLFPETPGMLDVTAFRVSNRSRREVGRN